MTCNEDLELILRQKVEWARKLTDRRQYLRGICAETGQDYRQNISYVLTELVCEQVGVEIRVIREELKQRKSQQLTAPRVRVQLKPQARREAFDRMMRGNYNKYSGEDV